MQHFHLLSSWGTVPVWTSRRFDSSSRGQKHKPGGQPSFGNAVGGLVVPQQTENARCHVYRAHRANLPRPPTGRVPNAAAGHCEPEWGLFIRRLLNEVGPESASSGGGYQKGATAGQFG
jgi:hypothetical protein